MKCDHDLTEREVSCYADGLCPICLVAENEQQAENNTNLYREYQDLAAMNLEQAENIGRLKKQIDAYESKPASVTCPKCLTKIKTV